MEGVEMSPTTPRQAKTLDAIETSVRRQRVFALALAVCIVVAYIVRAMLTGDDTPSAEAWGQFGDFVGGVLNPAIAFLAFYWLTQSVLIQRKELEETKQALIDSAKEQRTQSRYARLSMQMGCQGHMLQAVLQDIESKQALLRSMEEQMSKGGQAVGPDGNRYGSGSPRYETLRADLLTELDGLIRKRKYQLEELQSLHVDAAVEGRVGLPRRTTVAARRKPQTI
jgi:hypothetical protein